MPEKIAFFRFYAELNDFLPPERRKVEFAYPFTGRPSVKDAIEALGVPHPEVDLVVVDGRSVEFDHHLRPGDRIAVYPAFESLDITPLVRLRPAPLRVTRFIADVHLGKLARILRMLGFDTIYDPALDDAGIVNEALASRRIILTRDRGLLKNGRVTHGAWVRATDPEEQAAEILARFDLRSQVRPFGRCMVCNAPLEPVERAAVADRLEPGTASRFDEFWRCTGCDKVYWKGSHYDEMLRRVHRLAGPGFEP